MSEITLLTSANVADARELRDVLPLIQRQNWIFQSDKFGYEIKTHTLAVLELTKHYEGKKNAR